MIKVKQREELRNEKTAHRPGRLCHGHGFDGLFFNPKRKHDYADAGGIYRPCGWKLRSWIWNGRYDLSRSAEKWYFRFWRRNNRRHHYKIKLRHYPQQGSGRRIFQKGYHGLPDECFWCRRYQNRRWLWTDQSGHQWLRNQVWTVYDYGSVQGINGYHDI